MIKLDILSDPICPWCYIGKANLERALEKVCDHPFEIEWHPFQLNPNMPAGGVDRRTYLETKFGGQEGAVKAYLPVAQHAEKAGLKINFEGIQVTPNTLDAHRLIHWAGLEGKQTAMVAALFRAYFVDGRNIGHHETLADIAGEVGLDREMIACLLASDADLEDIKSRDAHSREMGVSAVPTFIVDNRHVVPGAQPPELWVSVIEEIQRLAKAQDT
jgi:predicted DsbA family dithiol-disulfide isomerase